MPRSLDVICQASERDDSDSDLQGAIGKITAQLALDLRLIDATTGEVLGSARGEGKASTTGRAADFAESDEQLGVGGTQQTPLGKAARQAVDRALESLAKSTEDVR